MAIIGFTEMPRVGDKALARVTVEGFFRTREEIIYRYSWGGSWQWAKDGRYLDIYDELAIDALQVRKECGL